MKPTFPTTEKISVITWSPVCRRSESLASQLGVPLHTVHYLWYRKPWIAPVKYVGQTIKTFAILRRERPDVVMVANPPLFAVLAVYAYCKLFGGRYIVDSHTGVFFEPKWRWLQPLNRFLSQRAALTIVTNEHLRDIVLGWGARASVLEVTLPQLGVPSSKYPMSESAFNVAAVFSFYEDEPVDEMLAVRNLPPGVKIHVTGDCSGVSNKLRAALSHQVVLTGFLSEADYASLLHRCDAVIVLCTRPHTMLCGAYEAAALAKPILTSDWPEMKRAFYKGTVFIENSTAGIEQGIRDVYERRQGLAKDMQELRRELSEQWEAKLAECVDQAMARPAPGGHRAFVG